MTQTRAYDFNGNEVPPDSNLAVAKVAHNPESKSSRFFIKIGTAGLDIGHFYNEQSPGFSRERAKHGFEFTPVKAQAYQAYMNFLRTKSPNHFREAERQAL